MNYIMEMTVMRLTNTVSWRTAWVQHSKHTERWQPQWGVSFPHSHPLSYSSLPYPCVSRIGSTSRAPLEVAWRIHCSRGFRALQLKVRLKIQKYISPRDGQKKKKKKTALVKELKPLQTSLGVQSTGLGGTRALGVVAYWGSFWEKSNLQVSVSPGEPHAAENRSGGQCRLHRHTNHDATTPSATTPL